MSVEPILDPNNERFTNFPPQSKYLDLWNLYKQHESAFWRAEEIDYPADKKEYNVLDPDTKHFIEYVLAFFAGSDIIVLKNINSNFAEEVTINEAIELAKRFGDEKSGSFVNGVLDNIVKNEREKFDILKQKLNPEPKSP